MTLAAIAGVAVSLPALAQMPEEPGFEFARATTSATVLPGVTIVVSNPFGNVRARFGGYEGVVEVLSALQHFADEGERLEVEKRAVGDELHVFAGYRTQKDAPVEGKRQPGQRKRADLTVFVPEGAKLRVVTDHGLIQVRGARDSVSARSTSGNIEVRSIRGDIDLQSDTGEVVVVLESRGQTEVQRVTSSGGDIWLLLTEDGSYDVSARARGLVSTDFSMTLAEGDDGTKQVHTRIGAGATQVVVDGGTGHLRIRRRVSPDVARATGGEVSP